MVVHGQCGFRCSTDRTCEVRNNLKQSFHDAGSFVDYFVAIVWASPGPPAFRVEGPPTVGLLVGGVCGRSRSFLSVLGKRTVAANFGL